MFRTSILFCALWLASGCGHEATPSASLSDVGWSLQADASANKTINLPMVSDQPPGNGFIIPTAQQAKDGSLHIRFTLKDPSGQGRRYRYKIYYRNERYKFNETGQDGMQHPLAEENFYGSWTDPGEGFRISGPASLEGVGVFESISIRSDPRDEMPTLRWARDPRVGEYSLLIVAIAEEDFIKRAPPIEVQDIRSRIDGHYVEPYWYWLHGPGARRADAFVCMVPDVVRLSFTPDISRGVLATGPGENSTRCGNSDTLKRSAQFEQFLNHIDPASRFDNVPVIADVLGNAFTARGYDSTLCFTPVDRLVSTLPSVTSTPCNTLRCDPVSHCLEMRNPGCAGGTMRKENVGACTRQTFTYGRCSVHCQLSPLINDSDMWNGLTNAIWLIGTDVPGVTRRVCDGGYLSAYSGGANDKRVPRVNYAEIDFEVMKGMPLCPERSFPPIYPQQVADANDRNAWLRKLPPEVVEQRGKVAVACTNWDMACPDPPAFGIGCHDVVLDGRVFTSHRWERGYRAVTQKSMERDDELFGPDGCWFQIDWRPEEIFWRIGPSLDHMRVVGYMNSSMTSIPNVPMRLVVSQEFHNTKWWPGSPYEQGGIPFPAKDLVGRVFEVRVE